MNVVGKKKVLTSLRKFRWYVTYKIELAVQKWLTDTFGICQRPRCWKLGEYHRQNTAYVDDELNWVTLCPEHMEENEKYWEDRWADYYSSVM